MHFLKCLGDNKKYIIPISLGENNIIVNYIFNLLCKVISECFSVVNKILLSSHFEYSSWIPWYFVNNLGVGKVLVPWILSMKSLLILL